MIPASETTSTDNVVSHPAARCYNDVKSSNFVYINKLIEAFTYAVEQAAPRQPLLQKINSGKISTSFGGDERPFIDWCNKRAFVSQAIEEPSFDADQVDAVNPEIDNELLGPEDSFGDYGEDESSGQSSYLMSQAVESVRAVLDRGQRMTQRGSESRYWYFRPAWQIESPLWDEVFGEDDPALVIAQYLRELFSDDDPQSHTMHPSLTPRRAVELQPEDVAIIHFIIDALSTSLTQKTIRNPHPTNKERYKRVLIMLCGLEDFFVEPLRWSDEDFCEVLTSMPIHLAVKLTESWAARLLCPHDSDDIDFDDEDTRNQLHTQSRLFSDVIRVHSGAEPLHFHDCPEIDSLSDVTIYGILDNIKNIAEGAGDTGDLPNAMISIYQNRGSVYAGQLPFTFGDARDFLFDFRRSKEKWVYFVSNYHPDFDQDEADPLWVVPILDDTKSNAVAGSRTDKRAVQRFEYAFATSELFIEEGLHHLATAWWAFFLATQSIAFGGLGLPPRLVKEAARFTSTFRLVPMLEKSLSLLLSEVDRSKLVHEKCETRYHFLENAPSLETGSRGNLHEIAGNEDVLRQFLVKRIGRQTWDALHPDTRADLIEAEKYFAASYRELGAGRTDWIRLTSIYAGAIEREVVIRIKPLILSGVSSGLITDCPPKLTFGSCTHFIKLLKDAIRKSNSHDLDPEKSNSIRKASDLFAGNLHVVDIRNMSAHPDPEKPVTWHHLLRLRASVYTDGYLGLLLSA